MDSAKAGIANIAGIPPIPMTDWLSSVPYNRVDLAYDFLLYIVDRVRAGKGVSEIGCMFQKESLLVLHYTLTEEDRSNKPIFLNTEEIWIALKLDIFTER